MSKFYLTTPIYYVNGKPHIGHAYTTVAADVIARYQKQKIGAENVFFLTGTDEHGIHIADAAKANNKSPKEFCDEMVPYFKRSWENLGIDFTHFIRTTDPQHKQGARNFLTALKEKGALYEGEYKGLYCKGCESFLTEKDLDAQGNCPHHQKRPEMVSEKNWFFKLNQYLGEVQKAILDETICIEPDARKVEVLGLFKQGMSDFSISRPTVQWGIPLPWDEQQTIYVWVEALLNYWTALFYPENAVAQNGFWPPDLQIIGKDITKFHCIYWPAILLAYYNGDTANMPKKIFAHGFFTINGKKMSKTIGNVINPDTLVASYGVDGARYLILTQFPFGADGDIDQEKFTEKYNADLANGIGNLASRIAALVVKHTALERELFKIAETAYAKNSLNNPYSRAMDAAQLFEGLQIIKNHIQGANEFFAKTCPWKIDPQLDKQKIVKILSEAIARILIIRDMIKPFMPQTAARLTSLFAYDSARSAAPAALFPRI